MAGQHRAHSGAPDRGGRKKAANRVGANLNFESTLKLFHLNYGAVRYSESESRKDILSVCPSISARS